MPKIADSAKLESVIYLAKHADQVLVEKKVTGHKKLQQNQIVTPNFDMFNEEQNNKGAKQFLFIIAIK